MSSTHKSTKTSIKVAKSFSELIVTPDTSTDLASRIFDANGVVAFSTLKSIDEVSQWYDDGVAICERFRRLGESAPGGLGLGKEKGFLELVNKDICRFDISLEDCKDERSMNLIEDIRRHAETTISPLLIELFGPNYRLNGQGFVVSYPGAASQRLHIDSSWLFRNLPEQPCHFVTVFVTLLPAVAPTEFCLGSQKHTHDLGREAVPEQYPNDEYCARIQALSVVTPGILSTQAGPGDVIVMDGRTLHRGLGNDEKVRPVAYFSFCPPWYREWPTSQMKDGRRLF